MRALIVLAVASTLMIASAAAASELRFDPNGDGVMTTEEARAGLTAQIEAADADHNGVWTHEEILTFTDARLIEVMFDADGDGTWSRAEASTAIDTFTEAAMGCDGDASGTVTSDEIDSCAARTTGQ